MRPTSSTLSRISPRPYVFSRPHIGVNPQSCYGPWPMNTLAVPPSPKELILAHHPRYRSRAVIVHDIPPVWCDRHAIDMQHSRNERRVWFPISLRLHRVGARKREFISMLALCSPNGFLLTCVHLQIHPIPSSSRPAWLRITSLATLRRLRVPHCLPMCFACRIPMRLPALQVLPMLPGIPDDKM